MRKYFSYIFMLAATIAATSNAQAQFVKKYQWDFLTLGFLQAASKPIPTVDGTTHDIGNGELAMINTALWYNIDRKISVGITGGFLSNFTMFDRSEGILIEPKDVRYNGFSTGISGKYIFFDKRWFKAFGHGGVGYTFGHTLVPTYIKVYNPADNSFYYLYTNRQVKYYNSMGVNFGVGATTFFSKGFGMNFILGYQNNGYYKGPYFNLGFFAAFKND